MFWLGTYIASDTPLAHQPIVTCFGERPIRANQDTPLQILTIDQHQQGVTTNGSYRAPGKSRPKTRRRIPWQVSWLAGPRLLPTFPGWSRVAFSGSCLTAHSCGYSRRSGPKKLSSPTTFPIISRILSFMGNHGRRGCYEK